MAASASPNMLRYLHPLGTFNFQHIRAGTVRSDRGCLFQTLLTAGHRTNLART
jgi:hypothetical protein